MNEFHENYLIESDLDCEQAIIKIKEYMQERDRLVKTCNDMIEHYKLKVERLNEQFEETEQLILSKIKTYLNTVEQKETKTQYSYQLPSAKIVTKKERYDLIKPEHIDDIPENYIKIKKELDWLNYKKNFEILDGIVLSKETGEIVENIEVKKIDAETKIKLT